MLILFGMLALANVFSVALGVEWLEWVTKPLLCPVLAAYVLRLAPGPGRAGARRPTWWCGRARR